MKPRVLGSSPVSLPGAGGERPRLQPVPSRRGEAPACRGRVSAVASGSFTRGEDFWTSSKGNSPPPSPRHPLSAGAPERGGAHIIPLPTPGGLLHPHLGGLSPGTSPTGIPPRLGASPLRCRGIGRGIWGDARAAAWKEPGGCRLWKLGGVRRVGRGFLGMGGSVRQTAPRSRGGGEDVQGSWRNGVGERDEGWMGNVEVAESHNRACPRQAPATQPLRWALGNSLLI